MLCEVCKDHFAKNPMSQEDIDFYTEQKGLALKVYVCARCKYFVGSTQKVVKKKLELRNRLKAIPQTN